MGRTNKLVDGCYSFWQGGLFALLQQLSPELLQQTGLPKGPSPAENHPVHQNKGPSGTLTIPSLPAAPAQDLNHQAAHYLRNAQASLCKAYILRSPHRCLVATSVVLLSPLCLAHTIFFPQIKPTALLVGNLVV